MGLLRTVVFAPEEMLLVVGSPGLRRAALDQLAAQRSAAYARDLATYGRTLQQRNSLLRAIREEQAGRDELRFWDGSFLDAGGGDRRRAPASARGPGGAARAGPTPRSPPRRPRAARLAIALRHERAGTPRRDAAGRPGPAPGGDGRQGGLERLDARRSAPRRPRLRARRPRHVRGSRRGASSGRRSSRSSWPSSTSSPRRTAGRRSSCSTTSSRSSTRSGGPTSSGGSPSCPRRSSRRRRLDDLDPALVARDRLGGRPGRRRRGRPRSIETPGTVRTPSTAPPRCPSAVEP